MKTKYNNIPNMPIRAYKCCLLCIVFCAISAVSFAQNQVEGSIKTTANTSSATRDSIRKARRAAMAKLKGNTFIYYNKVMQTGIPELDSVENRLDGFQIYDKAFMQNDFRAYRGDIGRTDQILNYTPSSEAGINIRHESFSSWRYSLENTPFYQTKTPYTNLFYANSFGKNLNYFGVSHTQNVYRGLNLAIDYNVIQSNGLYTNSNLMHHNFRFYGNFFTKDGRYRLQFGYIRNTNRLGENGGIKTDSLFTNNIETNRLRIPVNLETAVGRWRDNSYFVKQVYHIYDNKQDSIPENDLSYGFIAHTFELNDEKNAYTDKSNPNDNFYTNYYINRASTADTINFLKMTNRLFYSFGDMEQLNRRPFKGAIGVKNEFVRYRDAISLNSFVTWFPFVELQAEIGELMVVDAYANVGIGGYNSGDFLGKAYFKFFLPGSGIDIDNRDGIKLLAGYRIGSPEYMKSYYFSNNFYWRNNWNKEKEIFGGLNFSYRGWWLKAYGAYKTDYVFYKKDAPVQALESFWTGNITIGKDFRFGRYIGWSNLLMLAYSSNQNYLHLPLFSMRESIYGIIPIKNLAEIQIGIDLHYNTPYHADAYDPALSTYYWQDEVRTGNSLVMDVWINFQIKRMNLFVKGQNIAQGMIAYDYISTPHYPWHDRCVRFGLTWRFYD